MERENIEHSGFSIFGCDVYKSEIVPKDEIWFLSKDKIYKIENRKDDKL